MNSLLSPILGSYGKNDCQFLLEKTECEFFSIEEKERLIQSGKRHYSELLNKESKPSNDYQDLFFDFTEKYKKKLAEHVFILAGKINAYQDGPITLVSLARAGTPIGVLVKRALEYYFNRDVVHYSVSIIRDRGLDSVALDYLIKTKKYKSKSLVFIDGWTAKGVITNELKRSICSYNSRNYTNIKPVLYVISDTGGVADHFATQEDYPIPSSMLNSTVSGLISRSLWQDPKSKRFHGCLINNHLMEVDYSQWFIEKIVDCFSKKELNGRLKDNDYSYANLGVNNSKQVMGEFISNLIRKFSIEDVNYIKPGIAEATRVMLRRVPSLLIVRTVDSDKVKHLLVLAREKGVEVQIEPSLLFEACALIKSMKKES
ncbi:cysteine protease StiP family protein [Vibrio hyugaensis]|uniref:cysteine protease StiP family protein n=1 Tax=Vibrio hyugaensis TaxID=1534743 RepID=UPI000CE35637|nr:cysteine protease StiP family protein [Vibrio hyugaensis]